MEELIQQMNPWWETEYKVEGIVREKYLSIFEENLKNKDIILITGLRRIGKTTLMKQLITNLIKRDISPKNICYLSLDALAFNKYPIQEIIKKYREINNLKINEKVFLFLDEVAYKSDFLQELKNMYDLGGMKIFASSSSASLLNDRKGFLTGRARTVEIEPLDFQEFLKFRNLSPKRSERYLMEKYFKEYMNYGGIPEYVLTGDPEYIINLVSSVMNKDVIAAHQIKKQAAVKELFRLLCERVGKPVSYNKLAKILQIDKDTVKEYINYFRSTFLFFIVEKKGKLNEKLLDNKKLYCADIGIKNVATGFRDLGAIYENLVFLKIKKDSPSYIKKEGVEIDFYYKDHLIEAKFGQKLEGKQKELFDRIKVKNKMIAAGFEFFIGPVETLTK